MTILRELSEFLSALYCLGGGVYFFVRAWRCDNWQDRLLNYSVGLALLRTINP